MTCFAPVSHLCHLLDNGLYLHTKLVKNLTNKPFTLTKSAGCQRILLLNKTNVFLFVFLLHGFIIHKRQCKVSGQKHEWNILHHLESGQTGLRGLYCITLKVFLKLRCTEILHFLHVVTNSSRTFVCMKHNLNSYWTTR